MFSWSNHPRPIVALAPMAGVTDASYRRFIKRLAPEAVLYSEFLSTNALAHGSRKTREMMHFDPAQERPFIVQVFGDTAEHFLEAARAIEQMGADGIDINMGCPAAKVVSSCRGSALMKDPDLAAELVAATAKAVAIPVSVKTRLGWDSAENLIPFCQRLVEAGATALAIHGRTYKEKFTGEADWGPIYELKMNVAVPVIGNGDIRSAEDAREKLKSLDGVMVGRGTFGNPWLLREICDALSPNPSPVREGAHAFQVPVTFQEKIPYILEHCRLAVELKGEKWGMLEMRRHLSSYAKGFPGAAEMRAKLVRVESVGEVECILTGG
ncbi:MAG: tRNA-dihydrouridine synthase [Patescibacteria group bacterium]